MKFILLSLLLLTLTACPFQKKIDASSEDSLQKSIKNVMEEIPPEKQEKFQNAMKVIMFADVKGLSDLIALGQNTELTKGAFMAKIDGKTADEIIKLGEEITLSKNSESSKKAPIQSVSDLEKAAKEDATKEAMKKSVSATLKSKKFSKGQYGDDKINMVIEFKNETDKDISGVKGIAIFKDMFGDQIIGIGISYDEPIKAGQVKEWDGVVDYNQFKDSHEKLVVTDTNKIDFSFVPETIIFQDGTKVTVE